MASKTWRKGDNDRPPVLARVVVILVLVVPIIYAVGWLVSCFDPCGSAVPTARSYALSLGYRPDSTSAEIIDQPDPLGGCTVRVGFTDANKIEDNRIVITLRRQFMFGWWSVREHSITHFDLNTGPAFRVGEDKTKGP